LSPLHSFFFLHNDILFLSLSFLQPLHLRIHSKWAGHQWNLTSTPVA
jgi:hypothetical protein